MKYGQHIWIIYKDKGELHVFDDWIEWISINKDGLWYGLKDDCDDFLEKDIILYDEMDRLSTRIKELMQEIREEEKSKEE